MFLPLASVQGRKNSDSNRCRDEIPTVMYPTCKNISENAWHAKPGIGDLGFVQGEGLRTARVILRTIPFANARPAN